MTPAPLLLDPSALLLLATVARAGGIRSGALKLGIPRSTVSRRLAVLERAVGARLVVRTPRRFRLSDLGAALVQQGEQIEQVLRVSTELVYRESTEPAGFLRVAVAPLLGEVLLPELLAEYLRRYPRVRVELVFSSEYIDLRRSNVDVALRSGALADASDLYATRLGTSVTGLYASPEYVAARGMPLRLVELGAHDCIVVGGGDSATIWMMRERRRDVRVEVNPRLRVNDFRLARSLAAAGAGIFRCARFYAQELVQSGGLVPVLEPHWPRFPVFAVHTAGRPVPTKIQAFVTLVRAAARTVLDE